MFSQLKPRASLPLIVLLVLATSFEVSDSLDALDPRSSALVRRFPTSQLALGDWSREVFEEWNRSAPPSLDLLDRHAQSLRSLGLGTAQRSELRQLYVRIARNVWFSESSDAIARRTHSEAPPIAISPKPTQPGELRRDGGRERLELSLRAVSQALKLSFDLPEAEWAFDLASGLGWWELAARFECEAFRKRGLSCMGPSGSRPLKLFLGECLLRQGNEVDAMPLLAEALGDPTTRPHAEYLMGEALTASAPDDARKLFAAASSGGSHLEATLALGDDPRHGVRFDPAILAGPSFRIWSVALFPSSEREPPAVAMDDYTKEGTLGPSQSLTALVGVSVAATPREPLPCALEISDGPSSSRVPFVIHKTSAPIGAWSVQSISFRSFDWVPKGGKIDLAVCIDPACQERFHLLTLRQNVSGGLVTRSRFAQLAGDWPASRRYLSQLMLRLDATMEELQRAIAPTSQVDPFSALAMKSATSERSNHIGRAGLYAAAALFLSIWDHDADLRIRASLMARVAASIPATRPAFAWLAASWDPSNLDAHRMLRSSGIRSPSPARLQASESDWVGIRGGVLWGNGKSEMRLDFVPGPAFLALQMRGALAAGIGPRAVVSWNGQKLAEIEVRSVTWQSFQVSVVSQPQGNQLEVSYSNDLATQDADRNLYLGDVMLVQDESNPSGSAQPIP